MSEEDKRRQRQRENMQREAESIFSKEGGQVREGGRGRRSKLGRESDRQTKIYSGRWAGSIG